MKLNCDINIKHITRVEGHGNISIRIENGRVIKAQWQVVETPRFFEAILAGKLYENAPYICGRICGICSIGHTLASIRAIENCFNFSPSEQTSKLRLLLKHMETLQSHILHIYFLAVPDFMSVGSVLPLVTTHPDVVQQALRIKLLANEICDEVGGRRLHPVRTVVGGFTMLPDRYRLAQFSQRLKSCLNDLWATVKLFKNFNIPDFTRETEYVSLKGDADYPFIGGMLQSSDGVIKYEDEYLAMTNEYMADYSTSKLSRLSRESMAVGALARINNNFDFLHPDACKAAEELNLFPVNHNPFYNNIAQLVECVHVVHESIRLIDELLGNEWTAPRHSVEPKEDTGVGAVEVPRGILYHFLELDRKGRIKKADCVIPTSQNHANIQHDIEALAQWCVRHGKSDKETELLAQMLVRAYDPCISCSVH